MGQYLPGDSPVHRLDPRAKLLAAAVTVLAVLTAGEWLALTVITAWVITAVLFAGVKPFIYWKSMKALWIILFISLLFQAMFSPGETLVHTSWFKISRSGLEQGLWVFWRLGMLILVASVVTFTTTPLRLTTALGWFLSPLERLRVPVGEIIMIINLALRFVPAIFEEAQLLLMAQQSRGADFTRGNVRDRVKGLLPFLVPLLANIFRRADELALAMELRCYRVGASRSSMAEMKFKATDYAIMIVALIVLLGTAPGVF